MHIFVSLFGPLVGWLGWQDEQKANKSNNPSPIIREAGYLLMHNTLASVVVRWVMQHACDPSLNALFWETECQGLPSQQWNSNSFVSYSLQIMMDSGYSILPDYNSKNSIWLGESRGNVVVPLIPRMKLVVWVSGCLDFRSKTVHGDMQDPDFQNTHL